MLLRAIYTAGNAGYAGRVLPLSSAVTEPAVDRARGERVFMTLLIPSPPAVKNHAQTDNKNKYLTLIASSAD